jgi:hypothetical protein
LHVSVPVLSLAILGGLHPTKQKGHCQHGHRKDDQCSDDAGEPLEPDHQRGWGRAVERLGDAADLGLLADANHQTHRPTVEHRGPGVEHGCPVAEDGVLVEGRRRVFLHRHRLTGQQGFVDLEVPGRQEAQVRRNEAARP